LTGNEFYVINSLIEERKMDKKEIYEHLAKIYLDASLKKGKRHKNYPVFKNLFFSSLAVILLLSGFLVSNLGRNKGLNSEVALILQPDIAKINFNFNPAKKEAYTINLNKLNLSKYTSLAFQVKKTNFKNNLAMRVEFTSPFKERSEIYIREIPTRWKSYDLNFSDFKSITDWSEMSELSFTVEQWNTKEDHGVIYIDNVRFLK